MNVIQIAITDDDTLTTLLLSNYLNENKSMNVLFSVVSGEELFAKLNGAEAIPDIILLGLRLRDTDGIEVAKRTRICFPKIRVIIISALYQHSFTGFMLRIGVAAFLPRGITPQELTAIIETVMQKGFYLMKEQMDTIREQISTKIARPSIEPEHVLTRREIEILRLLCEQKTAREIADALFITQRTVEGHKNNLFAKTGVRNLAGLIIYAVKRKIILVEDAPVNVRSYRK